MKLGDIQFTVICGQCDSELGRLQTMDIFLPKVKNELYGNRAENVSKKGHM